MGRGRRAKGAGQGAGLVLPTGRGCKITELFRQERPPGSSGPGYVPTPPCQLDRGTKGHGVFP